MAHVWRIVPLKPPFVWDSPCLIIFNNQMVNGTKKHGWIYVVYHPIFCFFHGKTCEKQGQSGGLRWCQSDVSFHLIKPIRSSSSYQFHISQIIPNKITFINWAISWTGPYLGRINGMSGGWIGDGLMGVYWWWSILFFARLHTVNRNDVVKPTRNHP